MGIGDLGKKAQEFLNSDEGEKRSDQVLDKAEEFLDQKTGGKYDEQLAKGRDTADEHIGKKEPHPHER